MVAKSARFLAPIVLAAVGVGIYLLVHTALVKPHAVVTQSTTSIHKTAHPGHRKPRPKYYVVKQGDTLSSIAAKTGVSQGRLGKLNPSVSAPPYSLQTGQRLRLRQ
jgi:LysM repeat protein